MSVPTKAEAEALEKDIGRELATWKKRPRKSASTPS
jgi:hypothetical protein